MGIRQIGGGWAAGVLSALLAPAGSAQWTPEKLLPPVIPWDGASRSLVAADDDPWLTPAEASDFSHSPSYEETFAWIARLVDSAEHLHMVVLGMSPERRPIQMVVATKENEVTPAALKNSDKPILLAQAGIHSGEIDGKDAGMMLLRDLTVGETKSGLLDHCHFLFVPIFSVDGHERASEYNRINQRGPAVMGWRTTSHNLNLNRDYAKADSAEMRAMLHALNTWQPDLYVDLHVTDGADYQYDITFGFNGSHGSSPASATWMQELLSPALKQDLEAAGHIPGPLVFALNPRDMSKGLAEWSASPRYSNGYGDVRHLPTVLVENHSLKPYDQRVLGTYVLLESMLRTLGQHGAALQDAIHKDQNANTDRVVLAFTRSMQTPPRMEFFAVKHTVETSAITGSEVVRWLGQPETLQVPVIKFNRPQTTITRPAAYWIPPAYDDVIDRLRIHGIEMEMISKPRSVACEVYHLLEPDVSDRAFEGRVQVSADTRVEQRTITLAPGSVRVPASQPLGDLACHLLEPAAPDSFFRWGFFLEVLQRTEYAETYALEPLARKMLEHDPALKAEFEDKLANDPEFAESPRARLHFFYERSDYYDAEYLVYPVVREVG